MCYFFDNSNINPYSGAIREKELLKSVVSGFNYPQVPIITDEMPNVLITAKWRFNPALPDDSKTAAIGLNIRAEKSEKTAMFKDYTENHCIIPINGFYDWMHEKDPITKKTLKIKHRVTMKGEQTFYLAGLYRFYDKSEVSFGILTCEANELMAKIHNSKKRMPICLNEIQAKGFLKKENLKDFIFPELDPILQAENLEPEKTPQTLF